MNEEKIKLTICAIILGLLILYSEAYAGEIVIIANQSYPVDEVSVTTVREIYLGEKTREGGVLIRPVAQNDSKIRKIFLEQVLGTTVERYQSYWFKKYFNDGGHPPVVKESSEKVIEYVKGNPGAIGYVWKSETAGENDIKVIISFEVKGKKH